MWSPAFRLLFALGIFSLVFIMPGRASVTSPPPTPQQSGDEVAVRALVERFFAAYQKEDLEGLMLLWSEKSPDLAAGRQSLQRTFDAYEKIELTGVTVRTIKAAGEQVVVRLVLEMSAVDSKTGQPALRIGEEAAHAAPGQRRRHVEGLEEPFERRGPGERVGRRGQRRAAPGARSGGERLDHGRAGASLKYTGPRSARQE